MPAARAERIKRVAEKRREGKSTRAIAEEEGISQPQVMHDLKEAGDTPVSPEPETITGKDGKTYSATQPAKDDDIGEMGDLAPSPLAQHQVHLVDEPVV